MSALRLAALCILCGAYPADEPRTLLEAREGHVTRLTRSEKIESSLLEPPEDLFDVVQYPSEVGPLHAYLSKPPGEGKHPAMIWITGGDWPGGILEQCWKGAPIGNDQSANAYRFAGMVVMYPTFRGTYGNPGVHEGNYGEVLDVLAAESYLAGLDHVDAERIFLGGHDSGANLALLVAGTGHPFRGVVALGPAYAHESYHEGYVRPYDPLDGTERDLRFALLYLGAVRSPTFVLEGELVHGAALQFELMKMRADDPPLVSFLVVGGVDHYGLPAPANRAIAAKIAELGESQTLTIELGDVERAVREQAPLLREAEDLEKLAELKRFGVDFACPQVTLHYLVSDDRECLGTALAAAQGAGFEEGELWTISDDDEEPLYLQIVTKALDLRRTADVHAAAAALAAIDRRDCFVLYRGWDVDTGGR